MNYSELLHLARAGVIFVRWSLRTALIFGAYEIAMQTIEVARDFYDADWCGLINGDLDAGIFYPYWWVNRAEGRMAQTKFDEFEFLKDYDTWMHALLHGENVVLNGLGQKHGSMTGSEFRHYQKMDVQSVIGIPLFYHKPC